VKFPAPVVQASLLDFMVAHVCSLAGFKGRSPARAGDRRRRDAACREI
jgi:hypothetical protein